MFYRYVLASLLLHLLLLGLFARFTAAVQPAILLAARRGMAVQFEGLFAEGSSRRNSNQERAAVTSENAHGPVDKSNGPAETTASSGAPGVVARRISRSDWGIEYPPLAREMGKEGGVVIRCVIPPRMSRCRETDVKSSSGYDELDRAAMAGIKRYDRFGPSDVARTFDLSVNFELTE